MQRADLGYTLVIKGLAMLMIIWLQTLKGQVIPTDSWPSGREGPQTQGEGLGFCESGTGLLPMLPSPKTPQPRISQT